MFKSESFGLLMLAGAAKRKLKNEGDGLTMIEGK